MSFYSVAYLVLVLIFVDSVLAVVGQFSRKINAAQRLIYFCVCVCIGSCCGILLSPLLWMLNSLSSLNWVVARVIYYTALVTLQIKVEIEGEEILSRTTPCVMIGNHQSTYDIIFLGRLFPKRAVVLANHAFKYVPFMNCFMWLAGNIFIRHGNKQSIGNMYKKASRELVSRNVSVWVFPEGTRGRHEHGSDMLPFKIGAFLLAYHAKVPIVPVVIQDFHNIQCSNKFWSAPGTLKIKVLEPISMEKVKEDEIKAFISQTRELMIKEMEGISPPRISIS